MADERDQQEQKGKRSESESMGLTMPKETSICIRREQSKWNFAWRGFDGDDCFDGFELTVTEGNRVHRYDFGPSAKIAVRKLRQFFREKARDTVGGGFRNPDIRTYDVYREVDGYRLAIRFEGSGLNHEWKLRDPDVSFDPEYVRHYDGVR